MWWLKIGSSWCIEIHTLILIPSLLKSFIPKSSHLCHPCPSFHFSLVPYTLGHYLFENILYAEGVLLCYLQLCIHNMECIKSRESQSIYIAGDCCNVFKSSFDQLSNYQSYWCWYVFKVFLDTLVYFLDFVAFLLDQLVINFFLHLYKCLVVIAFPGLNRV